MADTDAQSAVPVTMGSPRFVSRDFESFRCIHAWFPPQTELEPHVHDRATFGVMLRGGFDLRWSNPAIRRRIMDCHAETVFTEPAGERHANRIEAEGASVLVIQIDPAASNDRTEPLRPLLIDRINHFRSARIGLRARRLARELHDPDSLSELAIESLALEMLVEAARRDLRWTRSEARPPWLRLAETYIRDNFRAKLRIADVAAVAGVHPAHLASVFGAAHGIPIATFIRSLRLEWAANQLTCTADAIATIAHSAGFADQSHFTRAFKRHTGRTPAVYRGK